MWKFPAERLSEPLWQQHDDNDAPQVADGTTTRFDGALLPSGVDVATVNIWETALNFIDGRGVSAPPPAGLDVHEMVAALSGSHEVERTSAAYVLGNMALAGDSAALNALVSAFQNERECTRRAATYGLAVSGSSGISPLIVVLQQPLPTDDSSGSLQAGGVGGPAGAAYALGGCAADAAIDDIARAATALLDSIDATISTLQVYTDSRTSNDWALLADAAARFPLDPRGHAGVASADVAVDVVATEHRRLLSSAARSTAILCQTALRYHADDPATATIVRRAATTLCDLAGGEEPGVAFPTYLGSEAVKTNATAALIKLCTTTTTSSSSSSSSSSGGAAAAASEPAWDGVGVPALLRRAEMACAELEPQGSTLLHAAFRHVVEAASLW
eukprot:COSAG06_NODE_1009_length_11087_cov_48.043866_4_plen_389_part_00